MSVENYFELLSKIKQKLLQSELNSIAILPTTLRNFPSYAAETDEVSTSDLVSSLESYGIQLRPDEKKNLLKFFGNSNSVNVDKFMYSLRGRPNATRQAAIDKVFDAFATEEGVPADSLRKVFNCLDHPRFVQGDLTEDQIFFLYLQNFPKNEQNLILRRDWNDYYAGVSLTVDDNDHFNAFIFDKFKLN